MAGLKTLGDLCEDFKSEGIPNLIRAVPDVSDLLGEIQELYDGEGAYRGRPKSGIQADARLLCRTPSGVGQG